MNTKKIQIGIFLVTVVVTIWYRWPSGVATNKHIIMEGDKAAAQGDYQKALKLWMPIARKGVVAGEVKVAGLYQSGKGVKKDEKKAFYWDNLAAIEGYPWAQAIVGIDQSTGKGVPIDKIKGFMWLLLAYPVASVNDGFRKEFDYLKSRLDAGQIARAEKLADEWRATHKMMVPTHS